MKRAEEKEPGNHQKTVHNFAILQNVSDSHLLAVAQDSCISFPSAAGNPAPFLSLLRAKELAQAELALARDKLAAEQAAAKAQLQTETEKASEVPEGRASPTPAGSGEGNGAGKRPIKKRKTLKTRVPVGTSMVTGQARARGRVSQ
jgi:hypothetical protein